MQPRPLIIANLKFKSPKRRGRGSGARGLRATLKYLQHRDDRETYTAQQGQERWVDHGLGQHYREIVQNCHARRSKDVLAWTWVISPEPDLLAPIPAEQRHEFIQELTEAVVERYYEERGGYSAPYSYVIHEGQTKDGRPHTHAHVILPGTAQHHLDGWLPFVNYKSKGHLKLLDEIANDELKQALDQSIGKDWRVAFGLEETKPEPALGDRPGRLDEWFPR